MKVMPDLKIIRRALGLTQEEFAGRYQIPLGTVRDWRRAPSSRIRRRALSSCDRRRSGRRYTRPSGSRSEPMTLIVTPAEAARQAAEEAWLDRAIFPASIEVYAQFLARLDEPPKPNERLRRTMLAAPPWE
jgi:transcriptional regulator with XRE-family HTH domain